MSKTLSVFKWLEIVLGAGLTLRVLMSGNSDWSVLYFLVLFAAINAVFFLTGLWAVIFRRELRRQAAWVMLLPVAFLILPVMLRSALGEPMPVAWVLGLIASAAAGALLWTLVRPRAAARRVPQGVMRSRALNIGSIVLLILGWIAPVALLVFLFSQGGGSGSGGSGMAAAYIIIFAALYFGGLGLTSLLVGTWGWVSFRGAPAGTSRAVHVWQMIVAAPGFVVGAMVVFWIAGRGWL